MIYMQSTLELKADGIARFVPAMKQVVEIVEGEGWRLVTAVMQISGRLHTAIDLWEMEDMNAYQHALGVLRNHANFAEISTVLAQTIERETVVFGLPAPWIPERN